MSWPHRWTCTRRAAGTQDQDTGAHTPGAPSTIYDGPADCQDVGAVIRRDPEGRAVETSDAVIFLEDESKLPAHVPGDVGTVTWEDGTTDDAEVAQAVRLDGKLHLRWL